MPEPSPVALPRISQPSRARAFAASLGLHGAAIALLTTASQQGWLPAASIGPRSVVRLSSQRVLWYTPPAELPAVAPRETAIEDSLYPDRRSDWIRRQAMNAASPAPESRRQMVLQEPPALRLERDIASANVVTWNPPRLVAPPLPKPEFRLPETGRPQPRALVETAPQVTAAGTSVVAPLEIERARWSAPQFQMPAAERRAASPSPLAAEAPQVASAAPGWVAPVAVERAQPPRFQMPAGPPAAARPLGELATPAPTVAATAAATAAPLGIGPARLPERPRFAMPAGPAPAAASRREIAEAPPPVAAQPGASTVIVGLDPAREILPPPPGNRSAQFSAGPDAGEQGAGPLTVARAAVHVPNLAIAPAPAATRSAPRRTDQTAFRRQLLASLAASRSQLVRANSADTTGLLQGSNVYTLAIDMPNITSYEGSWVVRFTELGGSASEDVLTAPVPLHKVDPKYSAAAQAERVEGRVLLYAVIRRDGRVDQVRLVQGVDERLDLSAVEAFSKWIFQPGTRNGVVVDLEAVVQIPFRAGPRASR